MKVYAKYAELSMMTTVLNTRQDGLGVTGIVEGGTIIGALGLKESHLRKKNLYAVIAELQLCTI